MVMGESTHSDEQTAISTHDVWRSVNFVDRAYIPCFCPASVDHQIGAEKVRDSDD